MKVLSETTVEQTEIGQSLDVSVDPSVEAAGVTELHSTLDEMADGYDVTGFKCVNCGLVHQHDTTKHRASDTFDMSDETAAQMDANSVCHCGVQELGRRGSEYGIDERRAAEIADGAPIPDDEARRMNDEYGSLNA